MSANVHAAAMATSLVDWLVAALSSAEWHYNADIGEMNVVLPGGEGRSAHIPWLHVDEEWDFYVRMDAATGRPVSLVIYPLMYGWPSRRGSRCRRRRLRLTTLRRGATSSVRSARAPLSQWTGLMP